ncbi:uncharacterized protein [Palaemon carinicauda]|uniref:uncharacterized protein n=1 Tax=Palaemon carinicauda TaxID=392227 RepID=UPI0035B65390
MFSDGSYVGYVVAAYLVLSNGKEVHSCLVMGKARLAPLKPVTTPRLEITSATVSVKLAQQILQATDIDIEKVKYYTVSTTVLHYIHSNTKIFPIFVTDSVRIIRDFSLTHQWDYVNTSDNPADIASRGARA